jgi:alpha-tubulin suppressor-like RCC1 family protein
MKADVLATPELNGTVVGWGWNGTGQATGIPTSNSPDGLDCFSAGPVRIEGQILSNVVMIAAGRGYSMALKKDGTVVAWGRMVNDLFFDPYCIASNHVHLLLNAAELASETQFMSA